MHGHIDMVSYWITQKRLVQVIHEYEDFKGKKHLY